MKPSDYIERAAKDHLTKLGGWGDTITDRIYARQCAMIKLLDYLFSKYKDMDEVIDNFYKREMQNK